jgi:ABC-type dipeptide/oligopeptide/nickel transport system permease subunit
VRNFWAAYRENRIAVVALAVVVLVVAAALLAPWIAPQDPYDLANLDLMDARRPPGFVGSSGYTHLLGPDAQGRDLLSAICTACASRCRWGWWRARSRMAIGATLASWPPCRRRAGNRDHARRGPATVLPRDPCWRWCWWRCWGRGRCRW